MYTLSQAPPAINGEGEPLYMEFCWTHPRNGSRNMVPCVRSPLFPITHQTVSFPAHIPRRRFIPRTRKPCRFSGKPCRSGGIPGIIRGFPGSPGTGKLQCPRRGFGCWNCTVLWSQFL